MDLIERLSEGNRQYIERCDQAAREDTAVNGQHPYAIVICCADSRVIPEQIFNVGIGELFVIRVAGNVLDKHQLGSIEYAAAHPHCKLVVTATVLFLTSRRISLRPWGKNGIYCRPVKRMYGTV